MKYLRHSLPDISQSAKVGHDFPQSTWEHGLEKTHHAWCVFSKPCTKVTLHCNHRYGHLKTEHTESLFLLRRHLGNWPRSKHEKWTAGSAWETWTVAAADGVRCARVRWEINFLLTFETAPFICKHPVLYKVTVQCLISPSDCYWNFGVSCKVDSQLRFVGGRQQKPSGTRGTVVNWLDGRWNDPLTVSFCRLFYSPIWMSD